MGVAVVARARIARGPLFVPVDIEASGPSFGPKAGLSGRGGGR